MAAELHVPIASDADIIKARQQGRVFADQRGFSGTDLIFIATAISEVARNIVVYAGSGEIVIRADDRDGKRGVVVIARDEGPGVADISLALVDGYSTGGGLGLGLPGARRLMDEFDLSSESGRGTTVTMGKWLS